MQHQSPRLLVNIFKLRNPSNSLFNFLNIHSNTHSIPSQSHRLISSMSSPSSWMDSIKGVFTGQKSESKDTVESFTLIKFADELKNARRLGSFKQFMVGRSSEATFADAFERMENIIRFLNQFDSTGENIQPSRKEEAAKHCNCTIAEVEWALSQFIWAKEAHKKMQKLKEEGKPIPSSIAEVQKMMGSSPIDLARSNLAKSGQYSRNAPCPCGSKKKYKRCCGNEKKA